MGGWEDTGGGINRTWVLTEHEGQTRLRWQQFLAGEQARWWCYPQHEVHEGRPGLRGKVAGRCVIELDVRPSEFEVTLQYMRLRGSKDN